MKEEKVISKEEMPVNHSDVQMIFGDLSHAFDELNTNLKSPKNVRRAFCSFVELSPKINGQYEKGI